MAEAIVTFQSQLSGVMETVFKAAMYEITRLVEDSFLEEVTRCREQVDSLKRRLKWSESKRKEREADRRGRCADCGRVGLSSEETDTFTQTEKHLKHENEMQEEVNDIQDTDGETPGHKMKDVSSKEPQSPGIHGEKLDRLLKEEALQISAETSETWEVSLDDSSGVPGSSKRLSDQKIPKCQMNWETGFDQRPQPGQDGNTGDVTEPLFQNRCGMEDLDDFDKTGYDGAGMIDMGDLDEIQGSPPHLGENLIYMSHYDEDVKAPEGAEHQDYQTGTHRNKRSVTDLSAGSPSRTNIDVNGEFGCLLINEEGYLQDSSVLYPEHVPIDSGNRMSLRGQGIRTEGPSLVGTQDMYEPSNAISDTTHLGDRLQLQSMGRGGRRHTCNLCSASFPDSASLKTHKQIHKSSGQGHLHSCNQCGKTFAQACSLKIHQRIHTGQGLQLCSQCGKGFPSFSELKTHKCGQTGDKPYSCTVCGNKFSRLWNLKLHRRIHTQEKPHQCSMCDKSFTRADILKVHQRTHTGERPYCCAVCGLRFKRLDHLKSHQRKHMSDL